MKHPIEKLVNLSDLVEGLADPRCESGTEYLRCDQRRGHQGLHSYTFSDVTFCWGLVKFASKSLVSED